MNHYFIPANFNDGNTVVFLQLPTEVARNPARYQMAVVDCFLNFGNTKLAKAPVVIGCNRVKAFSPGSFWTTKVIATYAFPDAVRKLHIRPPFPFYIPLEPHEGTDEMILQIFNDKPLANGLILFHFRPIDY